VEVPMIRALLIACLLPFPAFAERVMTGPEFEAFSTGKTMDYSQFGEVWGREEYLPNRRVRFSYRDDECREGSWYEEGPLICFVYDDDGVPKCWTYFTDGKNVETLFEGDFDRSEVSPTKEPLTCLGPDVGV
jgi:hypothetical protein